MKMFKYLFLVLAGTLFSMPSFDQTSDIQWVNQLKTLDANAITLLVLLSVLMGVILLLLVLMVYLMTVLTKLFPISNGVVSESWWSQFKKKHVTGVMKDAPAEGDPQLAHSYDGIIELDNYMPPWLKYLFYATIVFAGVYIMNFLVLDIGATQQEEYEMELHLAAIQAEERKALALDGIDEYTVMFDQSSPAIKAGQEIFAGNCAACHAQDGGGGVGPNLTDEFWIHGGSINDIFKVVKYGVPEKGMVPWQGQLTPEQIQQVSSYIMTLVGTSPANPKEAQGDKYEPAIEQPLDVLKEGEQSIEKVESL
jgi:cytochrome c oxidase cbb3-type subunit III